ncbi:aldose-1-epimerase [Xylariaceae sp. FL0255]|nr:aldose-1-epimerase [Xylariaceae sp. FL0255]
MLVKALLVALGAAMLSVAGAQSMNTGPGPDQDGLYWIYSEGLSAGFIPYGASISRMLMKDQYGITRDIVAGWDNATYYTEDTLHPHFGGVPGRYANRIKNSTFEIDGVTYNVLPNENPTAAEPQGVDTLHGGPDGWDWRNFTVVEHTNSSITFSILDPAGMEGFPGEVISYISYTLDGWSWDLNMVAMATTQKTPIMLSSHTYWNLDGFANNETRTALNHTLYMPSAGQRVATDTILIPTGDIIANEPGSVNDFWTQPKQLGASLGDPEALGNCGFNCTGYDTCYIFNRDEAQTSDWRAEENFVARLQSAWSGIQIQVYTDQAAYQVYSCNSMNDTVAVKSDQGIFDNPAFPRTIPEHGCVVMEVEDYIDGINQPEWGRDKFQIFGPGEAPYTLNARYVFSINSTTATS